MRERVWKEVVAIIAQLRGQYCAAVATAPFPRTRKKKTRARASFPSRRHLPHHPFFACFLFFSWSLLSAAVSPSRSENPIYLRSRKPHPSVPQRGPFPFKLRYKACCLTSCTLPPSSFLAFFIAPPPHSLPPYLLFPYHMFCWRVACRPRGGRHARNGAEAIRRREEKETRNKEREVFPLRGHHGFLSRGRGHEVVRV